MHQSIPCTCERERWQYRCDACRSREDVSDRRTVLCVLLRWSQRSTSSRRCAFLLGTPGPLQSPMYCMQSSTLASQLIERSRTRHASGFLARMWLCTMRALGVYLTLLPWPQEVEDARHRDAPSASRARATSGGQVAVSSGGGPRVLRLVCLMASLLLAAGL